MGRINRFVIVSVEDTGMGIAPEKLKLVFQRFWRADRARSYRSGGQGLGLSIAQAIAQQHDGEITVSSREGEGSCFRVRLPLADLDLSRQS
jgi:two-component system, OmpR family, manganese sensing sensor histidine kinase